MTIREKLALHDELEKRNADHQLSWKAGKTQTSAAPIYGGRQSSPEPAAASGTGHCPAIEIHARAILGSLDILAQHYGVKREALLDLLVDTLWAMQQSDEQEG